MALPEINQYPFISIKDFAIKYDTSYGTMRNLIAKYIPKRKAGKLRPNEHRLMVEILNGEETKSVKKK